MHNKTIVSVDIQPEYKSAITFIRDWVRFINKNGHDNRIIFLWNGPSLGMISEVDYRIWLSEAGIDEEILDDAIFYDKGYAFFRYCMDSGISHTETVRIVKFMISQKVWDSRDITHEQWDDYVAEHGTSVNEVRELLEFAGDCINIPDVVELLRKYRNIVLMGGGRDECLWEIEIALSAIDKNYELMDEFIY